MTTGLELTDLAGEMLQVEPLVKFEDIEQQILAKLRLRNDSYLSWSRFLLGMRIEICTSSGTKLRGDIVHYSPQSGMHSVIFDNGSEEKYMLSSENYTVLAQSARITEIEPPAISAARLGDLEEVRTWISNAPPGLQNHYVPFEVSDVARNTWTDVNARNEYGNSALHIASSWQKLDIVEYLLSLDQIDLNAP